MINEWYYGRGADISGPITGKALAELAANGTILPGDTVWREGVENGVLASNVKNLFVPPKPFIVPIPVLEALVVPPITTKVAPVKDEMPGLLPLSETGVMDAPMDVPVVDTSPTLEQLVAGREMPGLRALSPIGVVDVIEPVVEAIVPVPVVPEVVEPPKPPAPTRKARAIAGKGAIIVGQDGKTVKYKGKCTTCGYEDSSWKSMTIPRGSYRTTFFCNKCRKRRDVEIQGMM
jgi:hypothetical protein